MYLPLLIVVSLESLSRFQFPGIAISRHRISLWAHLLSLPDLGSSQCFVLFHCMFRYSHYSVYQPFLAKMNVVFKAAPGQDIDYIIQSAIIMIRSETAVPRHIYMYL